jgi:hypothetical protein
MVEIRETLDNQIDRPPAAVIEILEASTSLRTLKVGKVCFVAYGVFAGVGEHPLLLGGIGSRRGVRLALESAGHGQKGCGKSRLHVSND